MIWAQQEEDNHRYKHDNLFRNWIASLITALEKPGLCNNSDIITGTAFKKRKRKRKWTQTVASEMLISREESSVSSAGCVEATCGSAISRFMNTEASAELRWPQLVADATWANGAVVWLRRWVTQTGWELMRISLRANLWVSPLLQITEERYKSLTSWGLRLAEEEGWRKEEGSRKLTETSAGQLSREVKNPNKEETGGEQRRGGRRV